VDDLVLISDVDEIIRPDALDDFREPFATMGMRTFQYFLNYERVEKARQDRKVGVVEARMLQAAGLSALRVGMWAYSKRRVPNAGWHFSSVLTPEDIELKTQSYAHEEHQLPGSKAVYAQVIDEIRRGHYHPGFVRVPIDSSFPAALQTRPEAFAEFILPEPQA
jgi:beta-1,4-mannosyl-glycoprotein beta-1,4-N-acetylglucosaminyltransferase